MMMSQERKEKGKLIENGCKKENMESLEFTSDRNKIHRKSLVILSYTFLIHVLSQHQKETYKFFKKHYSIYQLFIVIVVTTVQSFLFFLWELMYAVEVEIKSLGKKEKEMKQKKLAVFTKTQEGRTNNNEYPTRLF